MTAEIGTASPLEDPAIATMVVERVRSAGSSFYWGMRLLDRHRRMAMYAVYAFCRDIDDIADEGGTPAQKLAGLEGWRAEIDAVYAGRPTLPLARALTGPVRDFGLPAADFVAVIDGCAMDARDEMRRPSTAALDLYCDRVACAVGRLSVRIFGEPGPTGLKVADSLGRALQLTNILRDLREDAAMGRLYLPDELLSAHGIAGADPDAVLAHPALPAACAELGAQARRHFDDAGRAMAACSRHAMRPAALMGAMYRDLLERCAASGWTPAEEPVRVPSARKMWYVLRHGLI